MKKQIEMAVLGSLFAVLPVFALGGDAATLAQLQAENAAVAAGSTTQNPQTALQGLSPVGQGSGTVSADLQAVQADNAQIQRLASDWGNVQQQAANYAQVASYASLSGIGPRVQTPFGIEQCHNVRWDDQIRQLITGGLNLAGDAEAEAYAMQAIDTQIVQDVADLMNAQAGQVLRTASAPNLATVQAKSKQVESAASALDSLLNGVGQQIAAAFGPNSTFQPLPLAGNSHPGIGSYPNLSAVQWIPGPDDGAPIGWYIEYSGAVFPRLEDRCPTGSANIPEISASTILASAQQAVTDEPALAPLLSSLEGGSVWSLAGGSLAGGSLAGGGLAAVGSLTGGQYTERMQLVKALGYDLNQVSNYMVPINGNVANFAARANALTQSLSQ
ncbi:MAG: hypothetical protein WCY91_02185 [Acidithiobacillus sp.]|jgi:hypothetical protein|uniref:hypothetical protein n=2 Tax=Acidithiobacillus sp. TaxID=1872118 RepID=UPI0029FC4B57|nr:hypothetical protein [Acidithiobacillus ferrooxidans]MDD5003745.1 hypothetical protein [Acidithiobacillus sp.]MDD5575857.1 hypothetical protein [Acidithiobacillus sp.]